MTGRRTISVIAIGAVSALACGAPALAEEGFLLIDGRLRAHPVRIVEINDRAVRFLNESDQVRALARTECIALAGAGAAPGAPGRGAGLLVLADGQRLPGAMARGSAGASAEILSWEHPWLGRVDVALEQVSALSLRASEPVPVPGDKDVIVLANGDRLRGFITGLGDPMTIVIDVEAGAREMQVPVDRAVGLALVTPPRQPVGPRIWFADGTMLDVGRVAAGDDGYLRLDPTWADDADPQVQVRLADVTAILFDPRSMVPLDSIDPIGFETSAPRFFVPAPLRLDERSPLGLGRIEYRGPLLVRYALPPGTRRFAAEATVPPDARRWADFELVVRDDDHEVYRVHLDALAPEASVNVALAGSELTIELIQAGNGPIQDWLILDRAMLLVQE